MPAVSSTPREHFLSPVASGSLGRRRSQRQLAPYFKLLGFTNASIAIQFLGFQKFANAKGHGCASKAEALPDATYTDPPKICRGGSETAKDPAPARVMALRPKCTLTLVVGTAPPPRCFLLVDTW